MDASRREQKEMAVSGQTGTTFWEVQSVLAVWLVRIRPGSRVHLSAPLPRSPAPVVYRCPCFVVCESPSYCHVWWKPSSHLQRLITANRIWHGTGSGTRRQLSYAAQALIAPWRAHKASSQWRWAMRHPCHCCRDMLDLVHAGAQLTDTLR